ncbi:putative Ccr4-associated factor [Quillaja saponaria]|uniref:poly(A)-specific ribonuclease n=1 Tax=Quillaja saponaria TaxID=32244 RepID=A0AAD7LVK6_QUISA|nr:putative Ccr4-associated factor [Quillaja saponaria]
MPQLKLLLGCQENRAEFQNENQTRACLCSVSMVTEKREQNHKCQSMIPNAKKPVIVREVWAENLEQEFNLIRFVRPYYPVASLDTEFPGVIYLPNVDKPFYSEMSPSENYKIMKSNVDALNIIQVGLTLSDCHGNFPDFGTGTGFIWEFNFRDFSVEGDRQNPNSIELLRQQGIDFAKNRDKGIDSNDFKMQILQSGLLFKTSSMSWVTFHSAYDFGYLIKILIRRELPPNIEAFMWLVEFYFGPRVYDMKYMMKFCNGLYGGLDRVAKTLGVERVAGKSHQAGSDSLLTLQTFMKLLENFCLKENHGKRDWNLNEFEGFLYGLEAKEGDSFGYRVA